MCKRYFVVGDVGSVGLNEVVETLVKWDEQESLCLVPTLEQATHLLVIANDNGDVQYAVCSREQAGPLPDLPVVVLMSDFHDVWEISLETAMGRRVQTSGEEVTRGL